MNALVDRWVIALSIISALLAASIPAAFWLQQEAWRQLTAGVSGDPGSPQLIAYGRVSAGYMLLNQAMPVLVFATGFAVVTLLVLLSRRWTALEDLRVRDGADA